MSLSCVVKSQFSSFTLHFYLRLAFYIEVTLTYLSLRDQVQQNLTIRDKWVQQSKVIFAIRIKAK